jgi:hypothetical protein
VGVLVEQGFTRRRDRRAPSYRAVAASNEELAFLGEEDTRVHLTIGDMDIV